MEHDEKSTSETKFISNAENEKLNTNDDKSESLSCEEDILIQQTSELPDNFSHLTHNQKENEQITDIQKDEDNGALAEKISVNDLLHQFDELDENSLYKTLKSLTEDELSEIVQYTKQVNSYISRENDVYDFILSEDEIVSGSFDRTEDTEDEDITAQESLNLTNSKKCFLAKEKLNHTEKSFVSKKDKYNHELQILKFELESLNMTFKDLKESKYRFDKITNVHERHPVTKKIILQKVMKYFDDSIQTKMNLANRYKVQIQSDMMERNKIFSQIKAQEKRLASLDKTEFQEAQFEHKKSCKQLIFYKEQLGKFKAKFSPLLQSVSEMKKALKEQDEMDHMKNSVHKLEHRKEIMMTEKDRYNKKMSELKAAMRKIKLDPRRHDLPEIIDYAAAKRENVALKKAVNKWKKKVELAQQEKLLYLENLSKKNMY